MSFESYLIVGLFIILLVFAWLLFSLLRKERYPYGKKNFLTDAERSFFKVLELSIGSQYYIFPQVQVASLVRVAPGLKGREFWKYHSRIAQKSLDFVLVDKKTMDVIMALELDDKTHYNQNRITRDEFLNEAFVAAKVPIVHIQNKQHYNPNELAAQIQDALWTARATNV